MSQRRNVSIGHCLGDRRVVAVAPEPRPAVSSGYRPDVQTTSVRQTDQDRRKALADKLNSNNP
ncbi:MAG: hypothetical protein AAB883_03295 [Patescibacteria group bacterium]